MVVIKRTIGYECDHCKKFHQDISYDDLLVVYGQVDGRSDMPYEFHFCNIKCLKAEINSTADEEWYHDVLSYEYDKFIKEND